MHKITSLACNAHTSNDSKAQRSVSQTCRPLLNSKRRKNYLHFLVIHGPYNTVIVSYTVSRAPTKIFGMSSDFRVHIESMHRSQMYRHFLRFHSLDFSNSKCGSIAHISQSVHQFDSSIVSFVFSLSVFGVCFL